MAKQTKTTAHVQYKLRSGTLVPGTTTVLGLLEKPGLHFWIASVTRQGLDWQKVRDNAADIGTIAHMLVLCELKGQQPDLSEYAPDDVEKANNCLKSFHNWLAGHPIKPIMVEEPIVSEKYGYGGTLDCYAESSWGTILLDWKTGKSLYSEYETQCAAYANLIFEKTGKRPDKAIILRINKENNDDFEVRTVTHLDRHFELFRHLLQVYQIQKELG